MKPPYEDFVPLGTHLLRIEGDSLYLIARGRVSVDDMRTLIELYDQITGEHGLLFTFYDGNGCTGIDPAARKLVAIERPVKREPDLQVAHGVSTAIRMVLNMLLRAQAFFGNRGVNLVLFDTENAARAFFEAEREKIRQKHRASSSL